MVPCPRCSSPLSVPIRGQEHRDFCPSCRREVWMVVWPAMDRLPLPTPLPPAVAAGEAACFSCRDRAATGVCDGCGSFTCPACEAEWFGESLCLTCLHARREGGGAARFSRRIPLYDNIALMLMVLPLVCIPLYGVPLAVVVAPVSLFLVGRHWAAPRGVPPRGPWRQILAATLALLLLLAAVAGLAAAVAAAIEIARPGGRESEVGLEGAGEGATKAP